METLEIIGKEVTPEKGESASKSTATAETEGAGVEISGSQAVLDAFVAEGVDTIFGYPGGAIMPIYDALYDYHDRIKHILVRHEQGGIHAGQGYARSSGRVGVVFATSGPGATNLVTGLADAMIDSTPLVCITGQVFAHLLGTDAFQEVDVINITTAGNQVELPGYLMLQKFPLYWLRLFISHLAVDQDRF
jgi:acetolactate synthase-1/2/3 large subunit